MFAQAGCKIQLFWNHCNWQCHTVHIKRFKNVLWIFCNQSYHNVPFPSKIKWIGREVCSYAEESFKEIYDSWDLEEIWIQQFLQVYCIKPNPSTVSGMSPVELTFARKVRLVLEKLQSEKKNWIKKDWYS